MLYNGQEKVLQIAALRDHGSGTGCGVSMFTTTRSTVSKLSYSNSLGTWRDKGFYLRSPPTHPQLQVTCIFAKICLAHR